jgi:electron transfer flavoprotein alpha subunit
MSNLGPIHVTEECTGCGLCLQICPFNCIEIRDGRAVIGEACRVCGECVEACPQGAIIIQETETRDLSDFQGVVVFVEHQKGRTHPVSYELLGKGRMLAQTLMEPLYSVIIGEKLEEATRELVYRGSDKVFVFDDPVLKDFRIDPYTDILSDFFDEIKPSIVLIGATAIGRTLGPRVAARLKTGLTADCTSLDSDPETGLLLQTRPAYGGNIMATIISPNSRPQMATVRYKVMEEASRDETLEAEIIKRSIDGSNLTDRVKILDYQSAPEEVSIVDANLIISGGKGLGSHEGFKLIEQLANKLDAVVGASRPTVDEGWMDYRHQVGLSGRTVRPQLYMACGISGAVQHLAGMKTSDVIIAVNRDPDAPIFGVSTLGVVGDLYEIIPRLIKKIEEYREDESI